jgi:ferritin
MQLTPKLLKALSAQVNQEFSAAYAYLGMVSYFEGCSLKGLAALMRRQSKEEVEHAMKLFDYVHDRGARVQLQPVAASRADFDTVRAVFQASLDYERKNSQSIYTVYELARAEKDHATEQMLGWFLAEQVEEEDTMQTLLDQATLAGDNPAAILQLDHEWGEGELPGKK